MQKTDQMQKQSVENLCSMIRVLMIYIWAPWEKLDQFEKKIKWKISDWSLWVVFGPREVIFLNDNLLINWLVIYNTFTRFYQENIQLHNRFNKNQSKIEFQLLSKLVRIWDFLRFWQGRVPVIGLIGSILCCLFVRLFIFVCIWLYLLYRTWTQSHTVVWLGKFIYSTCM